MKNEHHSIDTYHKMIKSVFTNISLQMFLIKTFLKTGFKGITFQMFLKKTLKMIFQIFKNRLDNDPRKCFVLERLKFLENIYF